MVGSRPFLDLCQVVFRENYPWVCLLLPLWGGQMWESLPS